MTEEDKTLNPLQKGESTPAQINNENQQTFPISDIPDIPMPKNNNKGQQPKKNYSKNETRASQNNKIVVPEGYKLEYRMKRLLFYMGYYTRVGIDVVTHPDENADKITDLDVYGIYIHKDFTSKTTWVDCKSGGVEIHKRISWIKGIMGEFNINDMIFVAGGARTSVKQYARKSGIQILDLNIIERLEKDFGIPKDEWKGSWNPTSQFNKINQLSKMNYNNDQLYKKVSKFISSDFWVLDNYTKSKRTITALRELSITLELPLDNEQKEIISWAIYELSCLFLLSLLNISKELYYFTDREKTETVHDGLISSDIPNKRRTEMFETAVKVAFGMVKNQYPDITLPQKLPTFNMTPPNYFESYNDLILRITNSPLTYYDLLRLLDYVFMEYDLQEKEINVIDLNNKFKNYSDIIVGAKTILSFISQTANIPRTFFRLLSQQIK